MFQESREFATTTTSKGSRRHHKRTTQCKKCIKLWNKGRRLSVRMIANEFGIRKTIIHRISMGEGDFKMWKVCSKMVSNHDSTSSYTALILLKLPAKMATNGKRIQGVAKFNRQIQRTDSWQLRDGKSSLNMASHGRPILWPSHLRDFDTLNFFFWGHLKSLGHGTLVATVEDLMARIIVTSVDNASTPDLFERIRQSFVCRCRL
ncbi:hypothetical protein TNCV_4954221 [Trichonephila clavipes]|nr:hypothetical protein TNCV_4954221 [Trichonephila clavipes]